MKKIIVAFIMLVASYAQMWDSEYMLKTFYDTNNDGIVDIAELSLFASNLTTSNCPYADYAGIATNALYAVWSLSNSNSIWADGAGNSVMLGGEYPEFYTNISNSFGQLTTNRINGLSDFITIFVALSTNGIPEAIIAGDLAGSNYVDLATNGLTGPTDLTDATNYIDSATNGLPESIISGDLAGSNYVDQATNGLGSTDLTPASNYTDLATNGLLDGDDYIDLTNRDQVISNELAQDIIDATNGISGGGATDLTPASNYTDEATNAIKHIISVCYSLPETITTDKWFYWGRGYGNATHDEDRASGRAGGVQYQGSGHPWCLPFDAKLISATIAVRGLGYDGAEQTNVLFTMRTHLHTCNWDDTNYITNINWQIRSTNTYTQPSYDIEFYSSACDNPTDYRNYQMLDPVSMDAGDLVALYFDSGSGGSQQIKTLRQCYITLVFEEE